MSDGSRRFRQHAGSWFAAASVAAGLASQAQAEELTQLSAVVVDGERETDQEYVTEEPAFYKLTTAPLDTPGSMTSLPMQIFKDQGATGITAVLRNVPGISIAAGEGAYQGDNLTIRGFAARTDFFLDGMRDFASYYRDPFNIERIDVLKGPDSLMFGRGSTGGVVSQAIKRPERKAFTRGSVAFGTDMTKRVTADVNRPIGEGAAVRLNAMAHDADVAGRSGAHVRRFGFAPSVAFGLNTDTRLTLDYMYQTADDVPDYGMPWFHGRPAKVARDNFYGFQEENADYLNTDVHSGTATLEHDFNEHLNLKSRFRYTYNERSVRITEPEVPTGTPASAAFDTVTINRKMLGADSAETMLVNQTDLTATFATGLLEHKLVTGVEAARESSSPVRTIYGGVPGTNLLNPNQHEPFAGAPILVRTPSADPACLARLNDCLSSDVSAHANTLAMYAVDTVTLSPQWELTGGVRYDHVESDYAQRLAPAASLERTDAMLSWRAGAVYKPLPNGRVYATVGTSFNPSIEGLLLTGATAKVDPEKNMVYEIGTKWDFLDKKLTFDVALFHNEKTNARTPDPNNTALNVLTGEQRVRGFEVQASGRITDKWRILAGYAYLDHEVTKSNNPKERGNPLANVPDQTFNFWSVYELPGNITVGGGVKAVSGRTGWFTLDPVTDKLQEAPGYATFDAMVKYSLSDKVNVQLNVYNLTDTYYFDQVHRTHVVPGPGRSALVTFNVDF